MRSQPFFGALCLGLATLALAAGEARADNPPRVLRIVGQGHVNDEFMRAVEPRLRSFASAFGTCAAQVRSRGITLSPEHEVTFTVNDAGRVTQVIVASREGGVLSECVSTLGGRLRLPRPPGVGQTATLRVRYGFSPAPSAPPGAASSAPRRQPTGARAPASR